MPAATRQRLEDLFDPEVRRLEALLGRDLAAWTRRDPAGAALAEGAGGA
jgi:hypothetical protein